MSEPLLDPLAAFGLAGQRIIITGASGALGRIVALALSELGARQLLVSGSAQALDNVAAEARARGGEIYSLARRPDDEAGVDEIFQTATSLLGGVDSVFVASGFNQPDAIEKMTLEQWETIMDANVRSPWLIARAFGRHAAERGGGGRLVLVSSVRGRFGSPAGYSAYSTSKGATDALTRTLATEWGPRGINVNAIAPTVFRSALTAWIFSDTDAGRASRERNLSRIPKKRLGEPEDFVGPVVFLLSAASEFVTGQILYVDGGYSAA